MNHPTFTMKAYLLHLVLNQIFLQREIHLHNYPVGDTTQYGSSTSIQRCTYHKNQWTKAVWECGNDNTLKWAQLKKLNWGFYALDFGPHNVPPMYRKTSKKRLIFNLKEYKQRLRDTGDTTLQNMRQPSVFYPVNVFLLFI